VTELEPEDVFEVGVWPNHDAPPEITPHHPSGAFSENQRVSPKSTTVSLFAKCPNFTKFSLLANFRFTINFRANTLRPET
jgi:hypothetical protein